MEDATVNIHKICKIIDKNIEKAENLPPKRRVSDGADDALMERMNQTGLAHAIRSCIIRSQSGHKKIRNGAGLPHIRFHDLRPTYVKYTAKNNSLQMQKSQTIKQADM